VKIAFAVEPFSQMVNEVQALLPGQWRELARDRDIPLVMDTERYREAEKQNILHVVTVRADGKLVGYYVCVVMGHLHYKTAGPMAHTDLYYLRPEFRKAGGVGARMFLFLEQSLKARGVVKIYLSTKVHQDHSELFEALGYRLTDKIFTKRI
jgi:N-acetylglutamate synthase-like GNAT family acetyltransferase